MSSLSFLRQYLRYFSFELKSLKPTIVSRSLQFGTNQLYLMKMHINSNQKMRQLFLYHYMKWKWQSLVFIRACESKLSTNQTEENSWYHSENHFKGKLFEQIEMIFDEKVSLVLRLYDLSNGQSQDIELSWTVLPYFIVPFTGRNMVIKFNTDIDNLNEQNLPRWVLEFIHVRDVLIKFCSAFGQIHQAAIGSSV